MPIRPDLMHHYQTPEYKAARDRIRTRAGGRFDAKGKYAGGARCEQCGVLDRETALRAAGWWTPATLEASIHKQNGCFPDARATQYKIGPNHYGQVLEWHAPDGKTVIQAGFPRESCRWVCIVLTTAHLNHTSGDDRDENLKLLCQWCHLSLDSPHHKETRARRKDAARPIFCDVEREAQLLQDVTR